MDVETRPRLPLFLALPLAPVQSPPGQFEGRLRNRAPVRVLEATAPGGLTAVP